MRRPLAVWSLLSVLAALATGALIALNPSMAANLVLMLLGGIAAYVIARRMTSEPDKQWLIKWVLIGFSAKMAGALARYYMVVGIYGGGDANVYHRIGREFALRWRSGEFPGLSGQRGFGTQVVEWITGAIYGIFTFDFVGGFLLFATLAFFGQLMFYAAFRQWASSSQLKPYAILIFLLPTYSFWPSSIGKDALIVLGLGAAAYLTSRLLRTYQWRWFFGLILSLTFIGLIRVHIAALVLVSLTIASLVARRPRIHRSTAVGRIGVIAIAVACAAFTISLLPDLIGVGISSAETIEDSASDILDNTSRGTTAPGEPVSGPEDIPSALLLVLFRPLILDATEWQHFFAAAETTLLLGFTLWLAPSIIRNLRHWRTNAYVVFCSTYVLGYAIAFSVIRNLGIIARQRGQVIALFLVIVVGLGWDSRSGIKRPESAPEETARGSVHEPALSASVAPR